jgi:hypothetical protein
MEKSKNLIKLFSTRTKYYNVLYHCNNNKNQETFKIGET